jgi:hypothetical protein
MPSQAEAFGGISFNVVKLVLGKPEAFVDGCVVIDIALAGQLREAKPR